MCACKFVYGRCFLFSRASGSGMAALYSGCMFNFTNCLTVFPKWLYAWHFHQQREGDFFAPPSLPTLGRVLVIPWVHRSIFPWFSFVLMMTNKVKHLFICLFVIHLSTWGKGLCKSFAHLWGRRAMCFLITEFSGFFISSGYIWFANIFCHLSFYFCNSIFQRIDLS